VLRDIESWGVREVAERSLAGLLHAELQAGQDISVTDLRDPEIAALGLDRTAAASSPQEHYPCTRTVARAIHASPQKPAGILGHSRQAEMTGHGPVEVMVLFAKRLRDARNGLTLIPSIRSSGALGEGIGRIWPDELLERLEIGVPSEGS